MSSLLLNSAEQQKATVRTSTWPGVSSSSAKKGKEADCAMIGQDSWVVRGRIGTTTSNARTDNVNVRIVPSTKGGRRLNRNTLFSFQVHGIHLGAHAVFAPDIVNGVDPTRVVQDALRQRRLPTVVVVNNNKEREREREREREKTATTA
jgi:hypothetical protein